MWLNSVKLQEVSYQVRGRSVLATHNFALKKGDFIWLRGGPGTGKSTLMKILCGLIPPTSGEVLINDKNIHHFSDEEMTRFRLRVGYLFETGGLLHTLNVEENLLLPLLYHKICSAEEAKDRVHYWLKQFKLSHVANQKPFVLSGSQRKAACALRAMIHEPELLLFDEPLAGLNDEYMTVVFDWISQMQGQNKLFSLIVASDRSVDRFFKSNMEWAA